MGLIKQEGVIVKGVKIEPAYAKITSIAYFSPHMEESYAMFGISTTRENLDNVLFLEQIYVPCSFDRVDGDLFTQAYNQAKEKVFVGWEDDIVTSDEIEE